MPHGHAHDLLGHDVLGAMPHGHEYDYQGSGALPDMYQIIPLSTIFNMHMLIIIPCIYKYPLTPTHLCAIIPAPCYI